jgi:hypothetical protein
VGRGVGGAQSLQDPAGDSIRLGEKPEQGVFRADVGVASAFGLVESASSLHPGEIASTLVYPGLPAAFAAGAFAAAREVAARRQPPGPAA